MANVTIDLELLTKQYEASINKAIKSADELANSVKKLPKKPMDELGKSAGLLKKNIGTAQVAVGSFLGSFASNIAVGALNALSNAVGEVSRNILELETAQVGLAKTTNLTDKEVDQLTESFIDLSKEIPVSVNDLLDLGQVAGQLGVKGTQNIALFSETISKLAVASDLAGEEGAKSLIRILNVTGEGAEKIENFASAIVDLGNNFAASESEIAHVATEVARSTAQFGIGSANVAGISTALKSLGIQAQLGGSVVGKAFRTINDAIVKGGKPLQKFAELTNLTGEQFKKTFEEDATKGFQVFIEALGRLPSNQLSLELEKIGLKGDEVNKVLPVLASRADLVGSAVSKANDAFRENVALNNESERAFGTLSSKLDILGNNFLNLGTTILSVFKPAVEAGTDTLNGLFNAFAGRSEIDETKFRLKELQAQLDRLNQQDPNSELYKGNEKLRNSIEQTIQSYKALISEQERASDPNTNIISQTALLNDQLKTLNDQLELTKNGFGEALNLDADKIKKQISELKNELKSLTDTEETSETGGQDARVVAAEQRNATLLQKEAELQISLAQIKEEARLQEEQLLLEQKEVEGTATEADLQRLRDIELDKIKIRADAAIVKASLGKDARNAELSAEILQERKLLDVKKQAAEQTILLEKKKLEEKKIIDNANIQSTRRFLSAGISLAKKGSAESKALRIADTVINTYAGATRAYADLPYPASAIASASIIAQGLANVSRITSAGNFEQGGVIPGSSFSGDNITANVNSGEMVLNRAQQSQLFNQANGGGSTNNQDLSAIVQAIQNINITLQADDNAIATSVSRGVANGIVIGESQ